MFKLSNFDLSPWVSGFVKEDPDRGGHFERREGPGEGHQDRTRYRQVSGFALIMFLFY